MQTTTDTTGLDERMDDWNGTPRKLFHQVVGEMAAQVTEMKFSMHFEPMVLLVFNDERLEIGVKNVGEVKWCQDWAAASFARSLRRELDRDVSVLFVQHEKPQPQLPLFAPEPDADTALLQSDAGDGFEKGYGPIPW